MLLKRENDYIPEIKRFIMFLRNKIFNDRFSLLKGKEGRNLERMKQELEKIFDKF